MSFLAQSGVSGAERPGVFDVEVLDEFTIPVGAWGDQVVDWIAVELEWLLNILKWPFDALINLIVGDILEPVSWVWVVLAFFVIGTLVRNVKVGAFAAGALSLCGILGSNYWLETVRTIGFVGVAVLLCVIIGIPLGVACGRVDGVWRIVRPVLDGMQVIHSFVYMLPFIFFVGIGELSATIVTMVFALPPLVRLTNLGVRQVPADVVEASRAYGAPEWRVLFDVQLPLARQAIATGINQTLLLAVSMLGIAAIMGAGGLGRRLLNAITNQDIAKGMASGLAFFLVAVVLDRITQPEGADSGGLLRRIRLAWIHRDRPERLLESVQANQTADQAADQTAEQTADQTEAKQAGRADSAKSAADAGAQTSSAGRFAPASPAERAGMLVAAAGAALAAVSVFLTWSRGAGFFSAYGREADKNLPGESFGGWSAVGGSWFGLLALLLSLIVLAAVCTALAAPGRGPRWFAPDGAAVLSLALLVMMVVYVLAEPPSDAVEQSDGIGVWLCLLGALAAVVGALRWLWQAPHSPIRPLSARISWGRVFGAGFAVAVMFVGAISGWSFDSRAETVTDEGLQAEIERLQEEAKERPEDASVLGAEISALMAQQQVAKTVVVNGISDEDEGPRQGPRLGLWTLLVSIAGLLVALPASGLFGRDEQARWRWSSVAAGVGAGAACVAVGWVATLVRSADPNYVSGVGSFLAMLGGLVLVTTAGPVLKEFRRSKVYDDIVYDDIDVKVLQ